MNLKIHNFGHLLNDAKRIIRQLRSVMMVRNSVAHQLARYAKKSKNVNYEEIWIENDPEF